MAMNIAIIDYGGGNLHSVTTALDYLAVEYQIVTDGKALASFSRLIFPGVGEAGSVQRCLTEHGFDNALGAFYRSGKPIFGICIGAHIFLDSSEESDEPCLGLVAGRVRRLSSDLKIPHMGWSKVFQRKDEKIFHAIPDGSSFYFVHSYYPILESEESIIAESEYGESFCAMWKSENLIATQFHPEKSAGWGLRLLQNWLEYY